MSTDVRIALARRAAEEADARPAVAIACLWLGFCVAILRWTAGSQPLVAALELTGRS